jgi:ABC-type antimicrobial peptide transport system permease subunit
VGFRGLLEPSESDPDLYLAMQQYPVLQPHLLVRSSAPRALLLERVREAVARLDPQVPLYGVSAMSERLDAQREGARFASALFAAFALLALGLAGLGLYAVIGYAVSQRRREIGTRIALGANAHQVMNLVLARGATLAVAGLGLGLLGALALSRLLGGLLVDVTPTDPPTYALTAAALGLVALAATWAPARRATRVDPIEVLRDE